MNRRNRQFRAGVTLLDGALTIPYLAAGALRVGDRNCRAQRFAGDGRTVRENASMVTTAHAAVGRQSSDNSFNPKVVSSAGQGCIRLNTTLKDGHGYRMRDDRGERLLTGILPGDIRRRGWYVPLPARWNDCRVAATLSGRFTRKARWH